MELKLPSQSHILAPETLNKSCSQYARHKSANYEEREAFHEGGKQGECGGEEQRDENDDPSALRIAEKAPEIARNHDALRVRTTRDELKARTFVLFDYSSCW